MLQDNVQASDGEYRDTYTEVATNCLRYLDLSLDEIDRLTLPEYELLLNAYVLKRIDHECDLHKVAWLTVSAGAMTKQGKPVYQKFEDFFNYEAEINKIQKKPKDRFLNLSRHLKDKKNGTARSKSDINR